MKFATECSDDLESKVKSLSKLGGKALSVMSVDDLLAQLQGVVKPAVGVLYEGAREVPAQAGGQMGVSGEIVFSVILVAEVSVISAKVDTMKPVHLLLDSMREVIHGSKSPTGHFWHWRLEAPVAQKGNLAVWIQRWSCPVQLPPTRK